MLHAFSTVMLQREGKKRLKTYEKMKKKFICKFETSESQIILDYKKKTTMLTKHGKITIRKTQKKLKSRKKQLIESNNF